MYTNYYIYILNNNIYIYWCLLERVFFILCKAFTGFVRMRSKENAGDKKVDPTTISLQRYRNPFLFALVTFRTETKTKIQ